MPPQQPQYGRVNTTAHGPEQYDFILNSGSGKKSGGRLTGASSASRVLIVVGGLLVLLLVAWVFLSFVTRSPKANTAALLAIAQKQTELARISQQPADTATQEPTRDFARTTQLSLLTEQLTFTAYLQKHSSKVSNALLLATKNTKTDDALKQAQINGNYDQVYISTAQSQLASYEHALSQAITSAKLKSEKQLLQKAYAEAQLLTELSKQQ
jgi:hypothetical protein